MVLRADVCHVEAFLHGLLVPFVVRRGAQVAAVVARPFVVVRRHGVGHFGVGQELVRAAHRFFEALGRQGPGHVVRDFCFRVIGHRVPHMMDNLAAPLPVEFRQPHVRYRRRGGRTAAQHVPHVGLGQEVSARPLFHIVPEAVVSSGQYHCCGREAAYEHFQVHVSSFLSHYIFLIYCAPPHA